MDYYSTTNILLLGETGVGKTTFVNSCANYILHGSIEEALKDPAILIDVSFSITSPGKCQSRKVILTASSPDNSRNEQRHTVGESTAQNPVIHTIDIAQDGARKRLQFIDTPGVNDTWDEKNFEKILKVIGSVGELHAVCILLKPNESTLTLSFRNALDHLLVKLHTSSTKNIVFCFTNTRSTLSRPGETLLVLNEYLYDVEKTSGVQIIPDTSNVFCFDNDCFRYLCTLLSGEETNERFHEILMSEWKKNVTELTRLLSRVQCLVPHLVQNTLAINTVQNTFNQNANALAEQPVTLLIAKKTIDANADELNIFCDAKAQIGIDIGTSYSRVAIFKDGRPQVLANELDSNLTPSYVAYTDKLCHVGEQAKHQAAMNVSNTVYGIRRMLGRLHDNLSVTETANLPYKLVSIDNRPKIQIQYKNEEKTVTPEDIIALLIKKMVKIGETALGQRVKKAVITVPSQFTCCQRQAIKDAAYIAGIESVLIDETTAAALAYSFERKSEIVGQKRNLLVFNMGGGFTTATIVTVENQLMSPNQEHIKVRATAGDLHLGGDDFDNILVDYCCQYLQEKSIDLEPRDLCRLRRACEKARRDLSFSVQTIIEFEDICSDLEFYLPITRAKFESMCKKLFDRAIFLVSKVLDTNLKGQIHEIVLVGGSTRMPWIQQQLRRIFSPKSVNLSMNQDEAAVIGAAVRVGRKDEDLKDIFPDQCQHVPPPKSKKHCPEGPSYPKHRKNCAELRNVGSEVPLTDGLDKRFEQLNVKSTITLQKTQMLEKGTSTEKQKTMLVVPLTDGLVNRFEQLNVKSTITKKQ